MGRGGAACTLIAAAVVLGLVLATTALAETPPPAAPTPEPDPPRAHVPRAQCIPTAGDPGLEEAERETTDPDGHPLAQLCPPGQVLVSSGTSRVRKDRAPMRRHARRHTHRHARH